MAPGRWGWGIGLPLLVMDSDFVVLIGWCGSLALEWSVLEPGSVWWPCWGFEADADCRLDGGDYSVAKGTHSGSVEG